jgi:RNA polymerase sigma-70 factor (ECF subfamily)
VIRRAFYRGLSTQQIAEDLKLSECEVKCRLHYGLRRLLILATINGFQ